MPRKKLRNASRASAIRSADPLVDAGIVLTAEQRESLRIDVEAVRRNIACIEALDIDLAGPAITFLRPADR